MNILVLAPQVPWPLHQGTAIRNYHVVRELALRHTVTMLAFAGGEPLDDPLPGAGVRVVTAPAPGPRGMWRRLIDLPTTLLPDLTRRLASAEMSARLASLLEPVQGASAPWDVIQIEGMEMAAYGLAALRRLRPSGGHTRLVYDAHNAEWVLQDRAWRADLRRLSGLPGALYSLIQTYKIRRFEGALLRCADATVAVSATDAAALRKLEPSAHLLVVPNGVDVQRCAPGRPDGAEPGLCVFVGKMDFRPNVDAMAWFCKAVWPSVLSTCPSAKLAIVGRNPVRRVRVLAGPSVEVTGTVDDVLPWLHRAAVVVVPLRMGGGTRLKVLEAMAAARPIVATRLAAEGLGVRDRREMLLADTAADQASAILELFDDRALAQRLGQSARARAKREFRWAALVPRFEAAYGST